MGDPATGLAIGGTADNLKAAIAGETHEYTDMYPGMAKSARDEGFDEIADWFETLEGREVTRRPFPEGARQHGLRATAYPFERMTLAGLVMVLRCCFDHATIRPKEI